MTDLEIQEYIEDNCRNEHGEPMMDEQAFYEGAKWYRDKVVNKLSIPLVVQAKPEKVCKGSWQLGNNCKKCKKCLDTKPS